jgi:hypothetical protein
MALLPTGGQMSVPAAAGTAIVVDPAVDPEQPYREAERFVSNRLSPSGKFLFDEK